MLLALRGRVPGRGDDGVGSVRDPRLTSEGVEAVAGEGGVVVDEGRLTAQLQPDDIARAQAQHQGLAAAAVAPAAVAQQRGRVARVVHQPRVHAVARLADDVRREHVCGGGAAHEARRRRVEPAALVRDDAVERHRRVALHWAQLAGPHHGEGDAHVGGWGRGRGRRAGDRGARFAPHALVAARPVFTRRSPLPHDACNQQQDQNCGRRCIKLFVNFKVGW